MAELANTKPFVPKELNLRFPEYEIKNRRLVSLENVSFCYGADKDGEDASRLVLRDVSIGVDTHDKVCLMGANGSGKSTLLKVIRGELAPTGGQRTYNASVRTASIPQGLTGFFTEPILLDNFANVNFDETSVRQYLGSALIRKDKTCDPVTTFSAGELMRAAVVKCILSKAEFLFLDEPTSHLDLESIEVLERLLQEFKGGFIVVSHDRSFVERVVDRLYYLDENHLRLV